MLFGIYRTVIVASVFTALFSNLKQNQASPIEYSRIDYSSNVTLVITSCNREDLLYRCLESMFANEAYKFKDVIVSDASGIATANSQLLVKYPFVKYFAGARISQVENIDLAYSKVNSSYILHFEEVSIYISRIFILFFHISI